MAMEPQYYGSVDGLDTKIGNRRFSVVSLLIFSPKFYGVACEINAPITRRIPS
jgi:hypothetical protein